MAFIGAFDVGQTIGVPLPCYYSYLNTLNMLGYKRRNFTQMSSHLQTTVEDLQTLKSKIDGLLITSPSNPTGTIIPGEQLKEIVEYCEENDILLISDEIYHGIVYNKQNKEVTALNLVITSLLSIVFLSTFQCPVGV